MGFPNPFAKNLCVPYWLYYPLRFLFTSLVYSLGICVGQHLTGLYHGSRDEQTEIETWKRDRTFEIQLGLLPDMSLEKERRLAGEVLELKTEVEATIRDTYPELGEDVCNIIIEFVDLDDSVINRDLLSLKANRRRARDSVICYDTLDYYQHWIALITTLLSFIAVISQFHVYLNSKQNNNSGWRSYQSFLVGGLYLSQFPVFSVLWFVFVHSVFGYDNRSSYRNSSNYISPVMFKNESFGYALLIFRGVLHSVWLVPYLFTHAVPGSLVFLPILFGAGLVSAGLLGCSKVADSEFISECGLLICGMIMEMGLIVSICAFIRFSGGQGWVPSFLDSLQYGYCDEDASLITFNASDFTWREWLVFITWLL